jgi:hypothetical protein
MNVLIERSVDDNKNAQRALKYPDINVPVSSLRVANSRAGSQAGRKLVVISSEIDSSGLRVYSVLWLGDEDLARVTERFLEMSTHSL